MALMWRPESNLWSPFLLSTFPRVELRFPSLNSEHLYLLSHVKGLLGDNDYKSVLQPSKECGQMSS